MPKLIDDLRSILADGSKTADDAVKDMKAAFSAAETAGASASGGFFGSVKAGFNAFFGSSAHTALIVLALVAAAIFFGFSPIVIEVVAISVGVGVILFGTKLPSYLVPAPTATGAEPLWFTILLFCFAIALGALGFWAIDAEGKVVLAALKHAAGM